MNPIVEGIPANENKNTVMHAAKNGLSCAKPLKSSYVTLTLVSEMMCDTKPNAPIADVMHIQSYPFFIQAGVQLGITERLGIKD